MRVLQRQDYENLAKEAVAQLVDNDVPLDRSLVKVSGNLGLNPDQIKALVQVANTLAHLDLFDRKNDGDKIVEFSPADPDIIVKKVIVGDCDSAVEQPGSLMDMFGSMPKKDTGLADVGTPVATSSEPSDDHKQMMIIRIQKVGEELDMRRTQAMLEYEEEMHKTASMFASLYGPDYGTFEKDAVALYGADAVPILTDIRARLRMPAIKLAVFEKTANLIDSDTPQMRSFQLLHKYAEDVKAQEAGKELLNHKIRSTL